MPRRVLSWSNLPGPLLGELALRLGLDGADPPVALAKRFGPRPTYAFAQSARRVLEDAWLAHDHKSLETLVKALWEPRRNGYALPGTPKQQLHWLASRNATQRYCELVLAQLNEVTADAVLDEKKGGVDNKSLAKAIHDVEGITVRLTGQLEGPPKMPTSAVYPYVRAAPGNWRLARWRERRFEPNYPHLRVDVVRTDGSFAHGRTLMSTLRGAAAERPTSPSGPAHFQQPSRRDTDRPASPRGPTERGANRMAQRRSQRRQGTEGRHVTRYDYPDVTEPRTPETGHTSMLGTEQVMSLSLDGQNWSDGLHLGAALTDGQGSVVVDLDPAVDPVLLWSGKRNQKDIPVLPLQRNEIVAASRIARIISRAREATAHEPSVQQGTLFADLEKQLREGDKAKRVEFYTHDEGWKNKLVCGDSLPVVESLLEYEGLRGRVQMIYIDPPYGIDYNANFQQRIDTAENDPKDQADDVVAIKAFRDTWALGIHSYLSYLQERLYLCRDLLSDSGSLFVQMNVENQHLVRALLDEVFGAKNYYATIAFNKTTGFTTNRLSSVYDVLLWYGKDLGQLKYHQLYQRKSIGLEGAGVYTRVELPGGERRRLTREELDHLDELPSGWRVYRLDNICSQGAAREPQSFQFEGETYLPSPNSHWKAHYPDGMQRLADKGRVAVSGRSLAYVRFYDDMPMSPISNIWLDTGTGSFTEPKVYAVQTNTKVVERCIAMTTDPGDLVFDPTCGSGTTALAAEGLGRRWVTCDTSRVAINVARRRLLSTVFDHYRTRSGLVSGGFVNQSVSRITLKSLAYDLEPEQVDLVDRPQVDPDAVRVTGPFEVATLGRYSIEDWKGYVVGEGSDAGKLENYIAVICRLYRRNAALTPSGGLLHAVVDDGEMSVGLSVGPISGRVTARQLHEAAKEAAQVGASEVHVLGWAFESNVNEILDELQDTVGVTVRATMIRPDTLAEGLKVTRPEMLFSPLAVPDVTISRTEGDHYAVSMQGVAVFDRKKRTTEYKSTDSGYVAGWYLDEDYDGDCFVDCQMFFDFKKKPAIERSFDIEVEPEDWTLRTNSEPFNAGGYGRVAVKVVDVFGNESTVVRNLSQP